MRNDEVLQDTEHAGETSSFDYRELADSRAMPYSRPDKEKTPSAISVKSTGPQPSASYGN